MKNILFIILFLFKITALFSQKNIKVNYTQIYLGKKTNSELLIDVQNKKSIFYNYTKEIKPGTKYLDENDQMQGEWIDFKEEFFKDFSNNKMYSFSNIKYREKEILEENINMVWNINKNNTKKILGYHCFLATTEYRGRKYIAYYTEELNVSDGPRKFNGLPGLILEIKEENDMINFYTTSIENHNTSISPSIDISKAKTLSVIIEDAKKIYYKKKEEIENKYSGRVSIDFSNNLEKYDLN